VLQYHLSDEYSTSETEDMGQEYSVRYIPAMSFNGGDIFIPPTITSYSKQAPYIEEELAKTPPVAIAATVSMSGNITVDVTFANTSSSAISGAELYVVLYEDLGEDEHHYTVRDILEPQEIASLAAGASQQISVTSNYSGSTANLHAVVFIKALDGEILQAALAG
jgi:hypothetical protein